MAYNISLTNRQPLTVIADGTVDLNSTSLSLVGKNYSNYGQLVNENFVHLLENFADTQEPNSPVVGQLWFDISLQQIKIRASNDTWKNVGSTALVASTKPTVATIGEQWWNTTTKQLHVYDGSQWIMVGPSSASFTGISGTIPTIIKDSDEIDHIIIKFVVNNSVVGIWCKEDTPFTVNPENQIPDFSPTGQNQILNPGLNLAQFGTYNSLIDKNTIWGTANNAVNLAGIDSTNYLRKDTTGEQTVAGPMVFNSNILVEENITVINDIYPMNDEVTDLGSVDYKFANIYAKNVIADQLFGSTGLSSSDLLPEGNVNLFFTADRRDEVLNYQNLTNKPLLISNVELDETTKTIIVTKTDNSVANIGTIVGYTGSRGDEGPPGNARFARLGLDSNSPGPADTIWPIRSISAFDAAKSLDFPVHNLSFENYIGMVIKGENNQGVQLAVNYDNEEAAPTGMYFRTNDTTGNANVWSEWSKVITNVDIGGSNNQVLYKNNSGAITGHANLVFDGTNLTCGGEITAWSDSAVKTNIRTIENPLDIIRGMRGVTYDRIDMQKSSAGLLADDAEKAIPVLVHYNNGIRSLNYNGFSGVFVEAIKLLEAEIEELKKQLKSK